MRDRKRVSEIGNNLNYYTFSTSFILTLGRTYSLSVGPEFLIIEFRTTGQKSK